MNKISTRRGRVTLYLVVTIGLGLMDFFRKGFVEKLPWRLAFIAMGKKMLLFLLIFAVLEVFYQLYLAIKQKQEKK